MRARVIGLLLVLGATVSLSLAFAQTEQNSRGGPPKAKKQEQPEGTFYKGVGLQTVDGKPVEAKTQVDVAGYALDAPPDSDRHKPFDRHRMMGTWEIMGVSDIPQAMSSRVPIMTDLGKKMLASHIPGAGPRVQWQHINDPERLCDPTGWPRVLMNNPRPVEFFQLPDRELQHWAYHDFWRTIFTDGRLLPKDPDPIWAGYSVGKWVPYAHVANDWEFVADTTGEDERTWLDHLGNPHSVNMMVHEVWHRKDYKTMTLDLTITDPAIYTEPWVSDTKLFEYYPNLEADPLPCVPSEELGYAFNFEGPDSEGPESLRTIGKRAQ